MCRGPWPSPEDMDRPLLVFKFKEVNEAKRFTELYDYYFEVQIF